MIMGGIASFGAIVLYKYFVENSSLYLIKTTKKFNFESDPYTGKVKCTYTDVPNKQHGYWVNINEIKSNNQIRIKGNNSQIKLNIKLYELNDFSIFLSPKCHHFILLFLYL